MITKVYELTRMQSAYFETKYCGQIVKMPFTNGRGSGGEARAELVVHDRFTQDAIEHDARFNVEYVLTRQYGEEETPKILLEEERLKAEAEAQKQTKKKPKKAEQIAEAVESVQTINDAYDYFASMGKVVETKEQLEEAMKVCNVTFPNIDL